MSKLETKMILRYWDKVGGTLIPEFQAVPRSATAARRLIDAVILPDGPKGQAHWRNVNIDGQDVIAVQAKAHRLGMYVMGQAVFSAELLRQRFRPKSVRSVILCALDDSVLKPFLSRFPEVEVFVMPGTPIMASEDAAS